MNRQEHKHVSVTCSILSLHLNTFHLQETDELNKLLH